MLLSRIQVGRALSSKGYASSRRFRSFSLGIPAQPLARFVQPARLPVRWAQVHNDGIHAHRSFSGIQSRLRSRCWSTVWRIHLGCSPWRSPSMSEAALLQSDRLLKSWLCSLGEFHDRYRYPHSWISPKPATSQSLSSHHSRLWACLSIRERLRLGS